MEIQNKVIFPENVLMKMDIQNGYLVYCFIGEILFLGCFCDRKSWLKNERYSRRHLGMGWWLDGDFSKWSCC